MTMMKRVRMRVLETFSRNLDGQIVTGHPKHPDEEGRFVMVSPASAQVLEDAGLAELYSYKDQAREELLAEGETLADHEEDDHDEDTGEIVRPVTDVDATSTKGAGSGAQSAQEVRRRRVSTGAGTKNGSGKVRGKPRAGKAPAAAEQGGAPVGGHDTNATTMHPETSTSSVGAPEATNAGANSAPDPDAAP